MVNFNKGCDVHLFFQEIIEAVSSIAKMWPKLKDWGDIWIKYLVNILLNKDLISCFCKHTTENHFLMVLMAKSLWFVMFVMVFVIYLWWY